MTQASVQVGAAGEIRLVGVLDYRTGPALRKQGADLIKASELSALVIDCAAVEKSSSVGLALLLGFMRDGAAAGKTVSVQALPDDMRKIAQVSELTEVLQHH
ncbi:STAS domain-containing protein [Pseudomonas huanghezhanensis]|uniref:STAS domain-containing protein n=1 Tax=Pseudomonas huanghezhanensis TaxID=3002903 RepID=UPI0022856CB6|nr:STAS domain-containing protein [Pseudomonas sp. BSw22131]